MMDAVTLDAALVGCIDNGCGDNGCSDVGCSIGWMECWLNAVMIDAVLVGCSNVGCIAGWMQGWMSHCSSETTDFLFLLPSPW